MRVNGHMFTEDQKALMREYLHDLAGCVKTMKAAINRQAGTGSS